MRPVFLLVVIFGVIWITYLVWLGNYRSAEYKLIQKGDSEAVIKQMLGTPSRISKSPRWINWDSQDSGRLNDGECVQEFWYDRPISLSGETWTVGFDRDGKVISKFYFPSGY